jgi:hypothetical protein
VVVVQIVRAALRVGLLIQLLLLLCLLLQEEPVPSAGARRGEAALQHRPLKAREGTLAGQLQHGPAPSRRDSPLPLPLLQLLARVHSCAHGERREAGRCSHSRHNSKARAQAEGETHTAGAGREAACTRRAVRLLLEHHSHRSHGGAGRCIHFMLLLLLLVGLQRRSHAACEASTFPLAVAARTCHHGRQREESGAGSDRARGQRRLGDIA